MRTCLSKFQIRSKNFSTIFSLKINNSTCLCSAIFPTLKRIKTLFDTSIVKIRLPLFKNDWMYILKIQFQLKSRGSGPAAGNKAEKRFLLCLCFDALFACVVVGDSVNKSFFSCNGSFHFSSIYLALSCQLDNRF